MENLGDIRRAIETIKAEVDAIQIESAKIGRKWYQDPSIIISITALVFSFGTTIESIHRTNLQDVSNSRSELRSVLERLAEIPKEQIENSSENSNDLAKLNSIDIVLNQENAFLTAQSKDIISRIPSELISPSEFLSLGYAAISSYNVQDARAYFEQAYATAIDAFDFNIEVGALRNLAYLKFVTGDIAGGEADFGSAVRIFDRYPGYDPSTKISVAVQTQINWATADMTVGKVLDARKHLNEADTILSAAPNSPLKARLAQTLVQTRHSFGF